jgi:hypothetical protein
MAIVHFVNYKRGTQSRAAMRGVMLYVMQEKKTAWEGEPLVSGINCQPQSVYDDFINTKLLYHKDGGVMFYHMVQSFPKGAEVDPRQAHEAARRLAEYFDGCEVLVCTHVDREHIHSHCVINSVNFETGKKLHMAKEQLQELMRRNDAVCQEMGLPVFDAPTQQARGMGGAEYHTALKGQSWKLRIMNTIDECMKYAADKDAFVSLMASEGYAVRWESGRKYITYTTPDGLKCRDNKLHEEKYCKEAMEHEFRIRAEIVSARTQAAQHPADSASDADTTSRSVSLESGLGANDEIHGCTVVPCGSADGSVGERQQADVTASHTDAAGRSAEDGAASGTDDRTGWEPEREVFLQVDRLAPGFQPVGGHQVDHAGADPWHGGTGRVVWRGGDPRPVPLIPAVAGLAAAGSLLDEDEDAEEKRRRMEAKIAAETFGAVVGFAAGAALAVKEKLDEHAAQEEQKENRYEQTMGGL